MEHLFERLVAETLEYVPPADVDDPAPIKCVFGWREPNQQVNQGPAGAARVVLSPGDDSGKVGSSEPAKLPGRNPKSVATMAELVTLYLWAHDPVEKTDLGQWRACRRLHDVVMPIVIRTFTTRQKEISKTWVRPDLERRFGAEMRVVLAVEAMIPDNVRPQVTGGTVTPAFTINGGPC